MNQRSNKRFTKEEDKFIIRKIKENPHNLSQCFKEIGEELGRSKGAISMRWYYTLAPKNNNTRNNAVFITYGKNSLNINRKIAGENTNLFTIRNKWKRIIDILFN